MSKKIKAKNKHMNQNIRGIARLECKKQGYKFSDLGQGVFRYRGKSNFNKKAHKANAYQARKEKHHSKSKGKGKSSFLASLFS